MTEKTHDEKVRDVLIAALDCATDPPMKASKWGGDFYVRRDHVAMLRTALDAYGIDWRALCKAKHPTHRKVLP